MYVSRDVKFNEAEGYFNEKKWEEIEDLVNSQMDRVSTLRFILDGLNHLVENDKGPSRSETQEVRENREGEVDTDSSQEECGANEEIQEVTPRIDDDDDEVRTQPDEEADSNEDYEIDKEEIIAYDVVPLRRSTREKHGPTNWKRKIYHYNNMASVSPTTLPYPIQAYVSTAHLPSKDQEFITRIDKERVPDLYEEAREEKRWIEAMDEEIQSMIRNDTWELTKLPKGKKIVGCRWVYTIKHTSTGEVERYKARLVAKGYTQVYGEDYIENFAPVAKLHSVRVLLSVAVNLSWNLWQMDVKNAFLQGDLEEEVYMESPQGYNEEEGSSRVCKLNKAIYGLKQSPRAWYQKLSSCLLEHGFFRSEADHSLFTKRGEEGIVVILIYVDDIIITGNDESGISKAKSMLRDSFDIKDLGELKYFLGIEMIRTSEGMFVSQRKYTLDLLSETRKLGSKPVKTPIEEGYKEEGNKKPWLDFKQYQRLVGKLIYLTITRPDTCFAVNQISKHMQAPTHHHWGMIERILRYLKSSPGKGIWMKCNKNTELLAYCDADWAGDRTDRKSTTGYCTFIGGNLVTWKSKKQKVVSLSSAEAEYRAMKDATKELMWLRYLLNDLGIFDEKPVTLHCDNLAAIHIASNQVFHERTKHIELDCHFVREKVQEGIIQTSFVKSEEQLADIFTCV